MSAYFNSQISAWKTVMSAFFNPQFSYCPLKWLFHSRALNNKINRLHDKYLWIIYTDNESSYEEVQWNLPIADIPNKGNSLNSGQNV